eukprot:1316936-Amorphochlora_amoeboformis.AAC.1
MSPIRLSMLKIRGVSLEVGEYRELHRDIWISILLATAVHTDRTAQAGAFATDGIRAERKGKGRGRGGTIIMGDS